MKERIKQKQKEDDGCRLQHQVKEEESSGYFLERLVARFGGVS